MAPSWPGRRGKSSLPTRQPEQDVGLNGHDQREQHHDGGRPERQPAPELGQQQVVDPPFQVGALGIHKFVLGQNTAGLITLLITLLTFGIGAGVMVVIGMVEGVKYLRMSDEEFFETYFVNRKAWF